MNRPSATAFLFVTVFVDMLGYGLVVPLLPFYADSLATHSTSWIRTSEKAPTRCWTHKAGLSTDAL